MATDKLRTLFPVGMRVEVKGIEEEGMPGSWFAGKVKGYAGGKAKVEFEKLLDSDDKLLEEQIVLTRLRPNFADEEVAQPRQPLSSYQVGDAVEGYTMDGWWEAVVHQTYDDRIVIAYVETVDAEPPMECTDPAEVRAGMVWKKEGGVHVWLPRKGQVFDELTADGTDPKHKLPGDFRAAPTARGGGASTSGGKAEKARRMEACAAETAKRQKEERQEKERAAERAKRQKEEGEEKARAAAAERRKAREQEQVQVQERKRERELKSPGEEREAAMETPAGAAWRADVVAGSPSGLKRSVSERVDASGAETSPTPKRARDGASGGLFSQPASSLLKRTKAIPVVAPLVVGGLSPEVAKRAKAAAPVAAGGGSSLPPPKHRDPKKALKLEKVGSFKIPKKSKGKDGGADAGGGGAPALARGAGSIAAAAAKLGERREGPPSVVGRGLPERVVLSAAQEASIRAAELLDPARVLCLSNLGPGWGAEALKAALRRKGKELKGLEDVRMGGGHFFEDVQLQAGWAWVVFSSRAKRDAALADMARLYLRDPSPGALPRPLFARLPRLHLDHVMPEDFPGHLPPRILDLRHKDSYKAGAFKEHMAPHFAQCNSMEFESAVLWRHIYMSRQNAKERLLAEHCDEIGRLLSAYLDKTKQQHDSTMRPSEGWLGGREEAEEEVILLKELSPAVDAQAIRMAFKQFADVVNVSVLKDPLIGKHRGMAAVRVLGGKVAADLVANLNEMVFVMCGTPRPITAELFSRRPPRCPLTRATRVLRGTGGDGEGGGGSVVDEDELKGAEKRYAVYLRELQERQDGQRVELRALYAARLREEHEKLVECFSRELAKYTTIKGIIEEAEKLGVMPLVGPRV